MKFSELFYGEQFHYLASGEYLPVMGSFIKLPKVGEYNTRSLNGFMGFAHHDAQVESENIDHNVADLLDEYHRMRAGIVLFHTLPK